MVKCPLISFAYVSVGLIVLLRSGFHITAIILCEVHVAGPTFCGLSLHLFRGVSMNRITYFGNLFLYVGFVFY